MSRRRITALVAVALLLSVGTATAQISEFRLYNKYTRGRAGAGIAPNAQLGPYVKSITPAGVATVQQDDNTETTVTLTLGGGLGGSNDGVVSAGTVTQSGGVAQSRTLTLTRTEGLEDVEITGFLGLANIQPDEITPGQTGHVGTQLDAARRDHAHRVDVGVPVACGTTASAGNSDAFSRSDHRHICSGGLTFATETPQPVGTAAGEVGDSTEIIPANHRHQLDPTYTADIDSQLTILGGRFSTKLDIGIPTVTSTLRVLNIGQTVRYTTGGETGYYQIVHANGLFITTADFPGYITDGYVRRVDNILATTIGEATETTLGTVRGITTAEIDSDAGTDFRAWSVDRFRRMTHRLIPEWVRTGNTDNVPNAKLPDNTRGCVLSQHHHADADRGGRRGGDVYAEYGWRRKLDLRGALRHPGGARRARAVVHHERGRQRLGLGAATLYRGCQR